MRVLEIDHPLVAHKLSVLRNRATHSSVFRQLADELVTLLCAPEGLKALEEQLDPAIDLTVVTAAIDEKLDEKGYIVPGLGDAGDRLFGVVD